MKASTSLSCKIIPKGSDKDASSFTSVKLLGRSNVGFSWFPGSRKLHCNDHLILYPNLKAQLVLRSHMTSGAEVMTGIGSEESVDSDKETLRTVHVKFQLPKKCMFGEQFLLVGDDPMLGFWNPKRAVPMKWSDGHIWSVELDMPIGLTFHYKFVLKGNREVSWQPGPDRMFKPWESTSTIIVREDWENPEAQKITEERIFDQIKAEETNLINLYLEPTAMQNIHHETDDLVPDQEVSAISGHMVTENAENELINEESISHRVHTEWMIHCRTIAPADL